MGQADGQQNVGGIQGAGGAGGTAGTADPVHIQHDQQRFSLDKLESEIFGALLAFAKNGTPDHAGLPHWPEVEAEDADTMVFDRKTEVKHNYDDKVFAEINKVLKPWSFMDMMADNIQH